MGRQQENTILMGLFTPFAEEKSLKYRKQEGEMAQAAISRWLEVCVCVCVLSSYINV